MVDTVRTVAALLTTLFQDGQAAGSITPQDARDLIVSLAPPEVALTFSASIAWNLDVNPVARVTLTGNTTITLSNGASSGQPYRLAVTQGGAGSFTPSFAGATLLGSAVWRTAPGAANLVEVRVINGVRYYTVV